MRAIAIVASRWNPRIVDALVDGALHALREHGVAEAAIDLVRVPGAWEIPQAAAKLARAAVAPRSLRWVASCAATRATTNTSPTAARSGLMQVALEHRVPVLNGVLAVELHADAQARAGGVHGNKGEDVALAALEIADLWRQL